MKRFVYRMVLSYMAALSAFLLFIPMKLGGLYHLFLFYPAQGEEQMGRNLSRLLFVLPPILTGISLVTVYAMDNRIVRTASTLKATAYRKAILSMMAAMLAILVASVLITDRDGKQMLAFMPAVYLIHTVLFGLALLAGRRWVRGSF